MFQTTTSNSPLEETSIRLKKKILKIAVYNALNDGLLYIFAHFHHIMRVSFARYRIQNLVQKSGILSQKMSTRAVEHKNSIKETY